MGSFGLNSLCVCVLVCVLVVSVTEAEENKDKEKNQELIQKRLKDFLRSHCGTKNQTVQQEELDQFASCNPTQAASTYSNLETFKSLEPAKRTKAIQKEVTFQCAIWTEQRKCQEKSFNLIEKCFSGQQEFVFYFMLALSDTICQDNNEVFIRFWENGGDACLKDHLSHLTKEIGACFTFTSTQTKEELDSNLHDITQCIGRQFSNCGNADARKIVSNLLNGIESIYHETRGTTAGSTSNFPSAPIISLTLLTISHRIIFS